MVDLGGLVSPPLHILAFPTRGMILIVFPMCGVIDDVFLNELTREVILPGFYDYWLSDNTGYLLLDTSIGYNINKTFSLSVAVKNLTNTEYMGRPGDIQPHRNYSIRLAANF